MRHLVLPPPASSTIKTLGMDLSSKYAVTIPWPQHPSLKLEVKELPVDQHKDLKFDITLQCDQTRPLHIRSPWSV